MIGIDDNGESKSQEKMPTINDLQHPLNFFQFY